MISLSSSPLDESPNDQKEDERIGCELRMSGGSSEGNGIVRHRHCQCDAGPCGYLEDDASSPPSRPFRGPPPAWKEVAVNLIWGLSMIFVVYYGDGRSNLVEILWSDGRIKRKVLYVGLVSDVLNLGAILYATLVTSGPQSYDEKCEAFLSIAPSVIGLGFFSFCSLSYALWPVWGFLTILLTITLSMASVVMLSYMVNGQFRDEFLRDD